MRLQPFLTATLFTAFASARISGIAVPSTIAPGSNFRVTILTQDYIQSIQDVAIAFGLAPNAAIANSSLGTLLNSKYLGPGKVSLKPFFRHGGCYRCWHSVDIVDVLVDDSNVVTNITHFVQIPDGMAQGPIVFTAALFSLLGAESEPSLETFSVDVTVGNFTSGDLLSSLPAAR